MSRKDKKNKNYTYKNLIIDAVMAVLAIVLLLTGHKWFPVLMNNILENFTENEVVIDIDEDTQSKILNEKQEEYSKSVDNIKDPEWLSINNEYFIILNNKIKYKIPETVTYNIIDIDKTIYYMMDNKVLMIVDTLGTDKYIDNKEDNLVVKEINSVKFIYNTIDDSESNSDNYNSRLQTIEEILNSIEYLE